MGRRTSGATPAPQAQGDNELLNEAGRAAFNGTHPQYQEMIDDLRGQYKTALDRLEESRASGVTSQSATEAQNEEFNRNSRFTVNPAPLFFDSPRDASMALMEGIDMRMSLEDPSRNQDTHVAQPTATSRGYNFGSEVNVVALDATRVNQGADRASGPQVGNRGCQLPVVLRVSWPVADLPASSIAKIQAAREAMGLEKFNLTQEAGRDRISFDVPTYITGPREAKFEASYNADGYELAQATSVGKAMDRWLSKDEAKAFLSHADKALPAGVDIPRDFTIQNSRVLKALGIDRESRKSGPTALDVLTGGARPEMSKLTPELQKVAESNAHCVAAVLEAGARTGIAPGASIAMDLAQLRGMLRRACGIPAPQQGDRPVQEPSVSSSGRLSVVEGGNLMPANLTRLNMAMGSGPTARAISRVQPNPHRNGATTEAAAVMSRGSGQER